MKIEKLAFKDRKELANLNSIDLLNIIEFLQQRMDKAIEYLNETLDLKEEYNEEVEWVVVDLFEILKGGNNERRIL